MISGCNLPWVKQKPTSLVPFLGDGIAIRLWPSLLFEATWWSVHNTAAVLKGVLLEPEGLVGFVLNQEGLVQIKNQEQRTWSGPAI